MPLAEFTDNTTGQIVHGINFGGINQIAYEVSGTPVYATAGGTSITTSGNIATLNPLGLTSEGANSSWTIVSHEDINTCSWRITVQNTATQEIKSGVYPFNLDGKVYQLECGGEWVMASCGGYAIVDKGGVNDICYTLKGTGETISSPVVTDMISLDVFIIINGETINLNTYFLYPLTNPNIVNTEVLMGLAGAGFGFYTDPNFGLSYAGDVIHNIFPNTDIVHNFQTTPSTYSTGIQSDQISSIFNVNLLPDFIQQGNTVYKKNENSNLYIHNYGGGSNASIRHLEYETPNFEVIYTKYDYS